MRQSCHSLEFWSRVSRPPSGHLRACHQWVSAAIRSVGVVRLAIGSAASVLGRRGTHAWQGSGTRFAHGLQGTRYRVRYHFLQRQPSPRASKLERMHLPQLPPGLQPPGSTRLEAAIRTTEPNKTTSTETPSCYAPILISSPVPISRSTFPVKAQATVTARPSRRLGSASYASFSLLPLQAQSCQVAQRTHDGGKPNPKSARRHVHSHAHFHHRQPLAP